MFEALIQQTDFASSTTAMIIAISALLGAVGPLILAFSAKMQAGKAKDIAVSAGQGATFASQKTVEYADRIKNILQAGYNLSPEQAKQAADTIVPEMNKLTEQVKVGTEQVKIIVGNVAPEARADNIHDPNFPREKFETKPDPLQ